MLLGGMVAGAPFFFSFGEGDGVALGDALASGVAVGLSAGDGDSPGVGAGVGDAFFFFLAEVLGELSGVGVGEVFFFFLGEADGVASGFADGVGLGEGFCFFAGEGVGDLSEVALGFGEGDFSAVSFLAVELLRCFRGAGVGVGAKIFLILLPRDSSAGARTAKLVRIARPARAPNPMANARPLTVIPSEVEEPRGASSDVLWGPSTSLRSARDDTRRKLLLRQLRQHGFVQPNAAFQILERKIFIGRMRAAIGQR